MAKKGKGKSKNTSTKKNIKEIKKVESVDDFDTNMNSKLIAVFGILLVFALFYLLTIYITSKNNTGNDNEEETTTTISYKNIIAGDSFSVSDGEYLVIYYDTSDEDLSSKVSEAMTNYEQKEEHLTLYVVDMHDSINTKYKSDEVNTHPNSASEIKIKDTTLIKFSDREVQEYIEGLDNVVGYLN